MFIFTVWKEEVLSRSQAQDQALVLSRSGVRLVSVHACGVGCPHVHMRAYKALKVPFLGVLSNVCRPMIVNYLMEKKER